MKNKPLTILFDANPLANTGKSGVGYYTYYLVQALAQAYPDDLRLVGHYYNFLGRKSVANLPVAANISYRPTKLYPGRVPNMLRRLGIAIPLEVLAKKRGDILLFTNFLTQPSLLGAPIVVAVHDLSFIAYPEFVGERNLSDLRRFVPQSIKRAAAVITISQFSKQALTDTYKLPADKIIVTPIPPLGKHSLPEAKAKSLPTGLGLSKPFILFIGNLEPRKNLLNLVEAYAACPPEIKSGYSLVIAGGKGWKNEQFLARTAELQAAGNDIVLPGYISDDQKAALLQNAALLVLPSFYEGFGMPVLEAFQYNVPVALSDIEVLREVAADAASYFSPDSPDNMAKVITKSLQDAQLRQRLIKNGQAELAKYSWPDNAKLMFEEFKRLAR